MYLWDKKRVSDSPNDGVRGELPSLRAGNWTRALSKTGHALSHLSNPSQVCFPERNWPVAFFALEFSPSLYYCQSTLYSHTELEIVSLGLFVKAVWTDSEFSLTELQWNMGFLWWRKTIVTNRIPCLNLFKCSILVLNQFCSCYTFGCHTVVYSLPL